MKQPERHGWTISEVERLVGLSRRDIQRCCYSGTGGVGVLSPKDGGWGRRTYDENDLATLFLVSELRRDGLTLSQAANQLKEELKTQALNDLLDRDVTRLHDVLEEVVERLVNAKALSVTLGEDSCREIRLRAMNEKLMMLGGFFTECYGGAIGLEMPGSELLRALMEDEERQ